MRAMMSFWRLILVLVLQQVSSHVLDGVWRPEEGEEPHGLQAQ